MSAPGGLPARGGLVPRGCLLWEGACSWGGVMVPGGSGGGWWLWGVWSQGVPGGDSPLTATAAGGTHPTGMHSCYACVWFC